MPAKRTNDPEANRRSQAIFRAKQKELGLTEMRLWVPEHLRERVQAYVARIIKEDAK